MREYGEHYSVLLDEIVDFFPTDLIQGPAPMYFGDLTFGAGGHSQEIAKRFEEITVLAVDQDDEALANGFALIESKGLNNKIKLKKSNFENFSEAYQEELQTGPLIGAMLDLGVSSHQLDSAERGLSFRKPGPLDMRMDQTADFKASDLVNQLDGDELEEILRDYGEERFSRKIAKAIVEKRSQKPFETTKDLEDVVFHCYPKAQRYKRIHPATRTFQALRIAVNRELQVLETVLPRLIDAVAVGGRIMVISFHSLEDRIVKRAFKKAKEDGLVKLLMKKPLVPSATEIEANSRSRSAKLRVAEKI